MSQVLSLIADPQKSPLQKKHIEGIHDVLNSLGARPGTGTWLSDKQAWQVEVGSLPADALNTLRNATAGWPVDVNIVPASNQRKKLLLADMDSTMIEQECIDELADAAGAGDAVRAITSRAMNGELDFEDALRERVAVLKDLPSSLIDDVIATRITFMPGGAALVGTMRQLGVYCALVSGGFTHFTSHVCTTLGFEAHYANELLIENGRLTGKVAEPILGQNAKVSTLQSTCEKLRITPHDVIAVGDGANDVPMLKAAGLGVAMHAKPVVKQQVGIQIDHGDLTALLYLQGISRDEFAGT